MAWAKFDDRWATHPKLLAAGLEAKGMDASGICYAAGQETDGFVPDTALIILGAGHRNPRKVADRLVDVGRWIRDDARKGYVIHDFDRYNFTRAQGEAKRTKDAERKAAARAKQGRDPKGRITSGPTDEDVRSDTDDDPPGFRDVSARTPTLVPPVPTRPDPTRPPEHGSSSSLDGVGDRPAEEEEDHVQDRGTWDALLISRLVAKRRHDKRDEPIPEGYRRNAWLRTAADDVLATHGDEIQALLAQSHAGEAIVDHLEPPVRPVSVTAPPLPYPLAGEEREPAHVDVEFDDQGHAFAVPRSVGA